MEKTIVKNVPMDKAVGERIKLRIATVEDASELLEIYSYYVTNTAITFEYDVPTLKEFETRMEGILPQYPYLIAEFEGKIVGYAYASPFKARAAYQWNVETSIYVHKDYKGNRIGKVLYDTLEKILKVQNVLNMNACIAYAVTEDEYLTNDSKKFHEKLGFSLVGEFHQSGFKYNRWYNMIWMEKSIGEHTENPVPVVWFKDLREKLYL